MSVNMASAGTVRLCSDDASRLEEAPEGLGGAQTWWGGAGRKPGQARLGPRPVLGYIGPFPRRSGAPKGLLPEFLWRSYNYMHVSVCPFRGCAPPLGSWLGSSTIAPAHAGQSTSWTAVDSEGKSAWPGAGNGAGGWVSSPRILC